ncbi:MAG: VPS10 domain-containing protein, partial [Candidatus Aminicenantales bacterium]
MNLMRRSFLLVGIIALTVILAGWAAQAKAPAKIQKKIEATDTAQRLKWFDQHKAMKDKSPFKDLKWRFVGPRDLGGRCTDIAVPRGSRNVIY